MVHEIVDGELLQCCEIFHRDHSEWVARFSDSLLTNPEASAVVEQLETSWKSALSSIESLTPRGFCGAHAKSEVAQDFAAWAPAFDLRARDLLLSALQSVKPFMSTPDEQQEDNERIVSARYFHWFDRFTRRADLSQASPPA